MLKYILLFFCLFVCNLSFATDYYMKSAGNDSNTGLSDGQAFATWSKLSSEWKDGDTAYLKRDSNYDERIVVNKNFVTIDAYGTGDKPIVDGIAMTLRESVTIQNINSQSGDNYYPIIINGSNNILIYRCVADGQGSGVYPVGIAIGYDSGTNTPYYSVVIKECEVFDNGNIVEVWYGGGIKFNEWGYNSYAIDNTVYNNIETNIQTYAPTASENEIYNITISGNTVYNPLPFDDDYETGINIGWHSRNVIAEKNNVYNCRVGFQIDSLTDSNYIYNNIVKNCEDSMIRILGNSYGSNLNSSVLNNTLYSDNGEINGITVLTSSGSTSTGHIIKNNLVYTTTDLFRMTFDYRSEQTEVVSYDMDYNCYYTTGTPRYVNDRTTYTTLVDWQTATSQDANSITSDPDLRSDFMPNAGSPVIDAGTNVGIADDYNDTPRPLDGGYEIGAVERYRVKYQNCTFL